MSQKLGVELSEAKTHISSHLYEFAKRWIDPIKKIELTGIPLGGIIDNINNPQIVFTILFDYYFIKANYYSYTKDLVGFISDLYSDLKLRKILKHKGSKKGKKKFPSKKPRVIFYRINFNRRFLKSIEIFSFSLKYAFGMLSVDNQRRFIYTHVKTLAYLFHEDNPISRVF